MTKKINFLNSLMILTLFFSLFLGFNNGNVYALEDTSYTVTKSNTSFHELCSNFTGSSPDCTGYRYFLISLDSSDSTFTASSNAVINFYLSPYYANNNVYNQLSIPLIYLSDSLLFTFPSGFNQLSFSGVGNFSSVPADISITLTLSENNPLGSSASGSISITENGTFDVSSYAYATVDVPQEEIIEDPISNDFQKVFFKIVEKIIPAFGIILVVWFGIDILSSLIFGRGR